MLINCLKIVAIYQFFINYGTLINDNVRNPCTFNGNIL